MHLNNLFLVNDLILYPLKIAENLWCTCIFRGYKMETCQKPVKLFYCFHTGDLRSYEIIIYALFVCGHFLFNTSLYKSEFSTYFFRKLVVFFFSAFCACFFSAFWLFGLSSPHIRPSPPALIRVYQA